jgi:hypothetical protein
VLNIADDAMHAIKIQTAISTVLAESLGRADASWCGTVEGRGGTVLIRPSNVMVG